LVGLSTLAISFFVPFAQVSLSAGGANHVEFDKEGVISDVIRANFFSG